jgi:hypothetical protein
MKIFKLAIGFSLLFGTSFSQGMNSSDYKEYLADKSQTDWAAAEVLTIFPDVKGWDEWHQGIEYIADWKNNQYYYNMNVKQEDVNRALYHFDMAARYATWADKAGRSGKGKNSTKNLRKMIAHGMSYIEKQLTKK